MNYKFNYKNYVKRIAKSNNLPQLKYFLYGKEKNNFLFPKKSGASFVFDITKAYKKKVGKILESNGFSNFEIIAAIDGSIESLPICIDNNNGGSVVASNLYVNNYCSQLINSLRFSS